MSSHDPIAQLHCAEQVFHVAYSPCADMQLLAAALIDGSIELWNLNTSSTGSSSKGSSSHPDADIEPLKAAQFVPHSSSCRGVQFSADGRTLYSISSDRSLLATNLDTIHGGGSSALFACNDAHSTAINRLQLISDVLIATGIGHCSVPALLQSHCSCIVLTLQLHCGYIAVALRCIVTNMSRCVNALRR